MDHTLATQLPQSQADTGAIDRADLYSAGTLATAPGGHGTQFGLPIPTLTRADQAEAFVKARVEEGSDYIKIIIEDGSEMGFVMPTLDQATVTALVQAATAQGKLTLVHVQTYASAQEALADGANGSHVSLLVTGEVGGAVPFAVTSEWQEVLLDLSTFDSCNVEGVQSIIFSAGPTPGAFLFQIDEVSFQ